MALGEAGEGNFQYILKTYIIILFLMDLLMTFCLIE